MRFALALLAVLALGMPQAGAEDPAPITLDGLDLGTHWFGPKITKEDLAGKVVLYVMWGSTTGSKQITPHMIQLAERLEGRPFHLIASHCEEISSEGEVVSYVKANGLSPHTPNLTVTKEGRHPRIISPGGALPKYPYYAIFDQGGVLVFQAMGSTYFGGDGIAFVENTEKAVAAAAEVWVGAAPYEHHADLAHKVASGKALGTTAKRIESLLETEEDPAAKAELVRLQAALAHYRDWKLQFALMLEGTRPSDVVKELKDLANALKGAALAEPAEAAVTAQSQSTRIKDGIAIEKKFRGIRKGFEKVKEDKRSQDLIDKTVAKLEKLIEGKTDLPIAATVEAFLANLR